MELFRKICHSLFYPVSIIGIVLLSHSCEHYSCPFKDPGYFAPVVGNITQSGVSLNGLVMDATSAYLEYGTSISYGQSASAGSCSCEADRYNWSCQNWIGHVQIGGLNPGTTYHFRGVAKYKSKTTYGSDHTFTTLP